MVDHHAPSRCEHHHFPTAGRLVSSNRTSFASFHSVRDVHHAIPPPFALSNGTLDFSVPRIMGVINATPDSFHGESRVQQARRAAEVALAMVGDGADIIDIGGQSSRPGATSVAADVECERVIPVIEEVRNVLPEIAISVDTFRAAVARQSLRAGADIVNDIGAAMLDPDMEGLLADTQAPCILMHMQGTPQDMQDAPVYADVVTDVRDFLAGRLDALRAAGAGSVAIDPGFGFGKTLAHNYALLDGLGALATLQVPLLVGVSRKSMIYKRLNCAPAAALNGTTALHAWALERGAHILRVHDVAEAAECVKLHRALTASRMGTADD